MTVGEVRHALRERLEVPLGMLELQASALDPLDRQAQIVGAKLRPIQ